MKNWRFSVLLLLLCLCLEGRAAMNIVPVNQQRIAVPTTKYFGDFGGSGAGLSNIPPSAIVGGVGAGSNAVKRLTPAGGGNVDAAAKTTTPDFQGQLAVGSYGSGYPFLFASGSTTAGDWFKPWFVLPGISQLGHPYEMSPHNAGDTSGMHIYFNGNQSDTRKATAGNFNGSYMFVYNCNPFSDGNGYCAPMVTTTPAGSPILTNLDGTKIYVANAFGLQMLSIPSEFAMGETNEAGSYVLLSQNDFPTYVSVNATMAGEAGGFYSQHYWLGFDARGANDSSKPLGLHLPVWTPYVWSYTNANNRESFYDERTGNFILYGGLQATNPSTARTILGPYDWTTIFNSNIRTVIASNTACVFPGNNGSFTWDSTSNYRLGVVSKSGAYPKFVHAAGAPFIVARSSGTDLQANAAGQTLTDELTIDAAGKATFAGSVSCNVVTNNGIAWVTGSGAPSGTWPVASMYSRTDTGDLYLFKSGAWHTVTAP